MFDLHASFAAFRCRLVDAGLAAHQVAELEDHLHTAVELAIDAGQPPDVAFAQALASIGNPIVLATEFRKVSNMHPVSKCLGLLIAVLSVLTVMWLEGGSPIILLSLPPLAMVLGVSIGGIIASHGPRRAARALAVAFLGAPLQAGEVEEMRSVCRRGHRLAYAGGLLQLILGVMNAMSRLTQPNEIGPSIAYSLLGLAHAVLVAELVFASAERWIAARTMTAAAV